MPASHYCPEEHVLLQPGFSSEETSGSGSAFLPQMSLCLVWSLLPSLKGMQTESLTVLFSASVEGDVLRSYTSQASFLKFILDIVLHTSLQVFLSSVILATETIWVFLLKNLNMGRSAGLATMSCCLCLCECFHNL